MRESEEKMVSDIENKLKCLAETVKDLRSRLSFSKEHEYRKDFKNLGRYEFGYRVLTNGEKQKCVGIHYTMHEDVRRYFSDLNDLFSEINNLPACFAIEAVRRMIKNYNLPMDANYVSNWRIYCDKFFKELKLMDNQKY